MPTVYHVWLAGQESGFRNFDGTRLFRTAMKKLTVSLVLVLLAAIPATADAKGSLDPSFGAGGRVLVPAPAPFPPAGAESNKQLRTASAPGGKLVALAGTRIMQFLASGAPDTAFGGDGSVEIAVEPNRSFSPVAVAVDSQGRILVAGTSSPPAETPNPGPAGSPAGPAPTRASVIRYLPTGNPDPSFGKDGIATTSFEIPPPSTIQPTWQPERRYQSAVVTVTGLAVTATDQPVVAGAYATEVGTTSCYRVAAFVARLDPAGIVDRSFGQDGVAYDPHIQQPEALTQSRPGDLFYSGRVTENPVGPCYPIGPQSISSNFADLLPTGQLNSGFGSGGQRPHNQSQVYSLAVDSRGRLVSLEQIWSSAAYPESEGKLRVRRLLPTGVPDPAFGRNGSVWPKASIGFGNRVGFQALAVDSRDRVLLAGGGKTPKGAYGFQLMRLGTKGKLDLGFGQRGRVKTGFGAATTKASAISLDHDGTAILGGAITGSPKLPGGNGFAFARYLLDPDGWRYLLDPDVEFSGRG